MLVYFPPSSQTRVIAVGLWCLNLDTQQLESLRAASRGPGASANEHLWAFLLEPGSLTQRALWKLPQREKKKLLMVWLARLCRRGS